MGHKNKAIGEMQRKFETRKKKRIEIHLGLLDFFLAWDDSPSLLLSPLVFISTIPSSQNQNAKTPTMLHTLKIVNGTMPQRKQLNEENPVENFATFYVLLQMRNHGHNKTKQGFAWCFILLFIHLKFTLFGAFLGSW